MAIDNLYLCYTPQNYFKALVHAHGRYERGESTRILALFFQGREDPSFFRTEGVYWAEVELRLHRNKYIRILPGDRSYPLSYLNKAAKKVGWRVARFVGQRAQRRALLQSVMEAGKVYLFLESTYFSSHVLAHRECTLIEEGLSSYKPYPSRIGRGARPRYPGEHANITEVLLRYPERAHERVRPKVKPLELGYKSLTGRPQDVLLDLFGLRGFANEPHSALIIGQAWSQSITGSEPMLVFYKRIVAWLQAHGFTVYVKPHPREDPEPYRDLGGTLLNAKMPLDLFMLGPGPYAFEVAVSFLESSIFGARRLAKAYECFLTGDTVVEEVSRQQVSGLSALLDARLTRPPLGQD